MTGNHPNAICYEDVVMLLFTLPPVERLESSFKAHPNTIRLLKDLKDQTGRKAFQDGKLLGRPIIADETVSREMNPGEHTLYFGHAALVHPKDQPCPDSVMSVQEAEVLIQTELERQRAERAICLDHAQVMIKAMHRGGNQNFWRVRYRCGHTFDRDSFDPVRDYLCPTCLNPEPSFVLE